jgi:cation:H+ antiporter
MLLNIVFFAVGLAVLTLGAEMLVRGSSRLALALGVRPVVVGLTVVAFGTSCPEFFVSFTSALAKSQGIAIGNVVGSNVANVGLVIGVSALIRPLVTDRTTLRREVPFMVFVSCLFLWFIWDGGVSRIEGGILFVGIILFTAGSVWMAMRGAVSPAALDGLPDGDPARTSRGANTAMSIGGLVALIGGAQLMIKGAVYIASAYHVPELVIGLSVVAIGTSLPELAASVAAAAHGESDICLGNVIGSNIFNLLFVIGVVAMVAPLSVDRATITQQVPAMIGFGLALALFMGTGRSVSRKEGVVLLLLYAGFIAWVYVV